MDEGQRTNGRRVALYARVSTQDQRPEIQLDALRQYAGIRGWTVSLEAVDHGISGRKDRRPGLQQIEDAVHRRSVDAVLITKLDRLARSTQHLTRLAGELKERGVDLVVLDQAIDTTTSAGKLVFDVLAAVAEFEGALIRERTKAGLDAARRRGVVLGGKPKLDNRQRARARRLRKVGKSYREIGDVLGVSHQTVIRALAPGK